MEWGGRRVFNSIMKRNRSPKPLMRSRCPKPLECRIPCNKQQFVFTSFDPAVVGFVDHSALECRLMVCTSDTVSLVGKTK
ncbi:hypothetical protein BHE74_00028674 [Ensete ventricosum]|nr:hypothetical protein BHE74_00028674 [Ensete ventricosum]